MDQNTKDNLVIYQKYMELLYYSNDIVKKYPKSETFAMATEIKNIVNAGLKDIMFAIKSFRKQDKLNYMHELDINLCLLKVQVRLSYKYRYISQKNYESWSTLITNICNMLGGWITSCQKR